MCLLRETICWLLTRWLRPLIALCHVASFFFGETCGKVLEPLNLWWRIARLCCVCVLRLLNLGVRVEWLLHILASVFVGVSIPYCMSRVFFKLLWTTNKWRKKTINMILAGTGGVAAAAAPAGAGVEGAVFVLVVWEVDGGAAPRLEVTSTMPCDLETLAQGRALSRTS